MNADEIVKALKSCGCVFGQGCGSCPYEYCSPACESLCGDAAALIESLLAQLAERDREIKLLRAAQEKIESCESCARYVEECYRFYTYPCSECKHRARDSYVPLPAAPEEGEQL